LESISPGNTVHIKKKQNASLGDDIVRNLALQLLHLLYDRDCRRKFMEPNQWLIKLVTLIKCRYSIYIYNIISKTKLEIHIRTNLYFRKLVKICNLVKGILP